MKRSEKQSQSKANFNTILQLICPNFRLNGIRVAKMVEQMLFKGVLGELKEETVYKDNHSQNI